MELTKIITSASIFIVLAYAYSKLSDSVNRDDKLTDYRQLEEYLLNNSSLATSRLPIIWIHIPREVNARNWESFYSRTNNNVNQPYMYLTIKSIIDKCGEDFNVCLIDDDSFQKIIPGWTVDMDRISDPHKETIRLLALLRILMHYGGVIVPPSLFCHKSLMQPLRKFIKDKEFFVADMKNESVSADENVLAPSIKMMGCNRENKECKALIEYVERLASENYTDSIRFEGLVSNYMETKIVEDSMKALDAAVIGMVDANGKTIGVEELLGQTEIPLSSDNCAIYLPSKSLLTRLNYRWFARLPVADVISSNTFIGVTMMRSKLSEN